MEIPEIQYRPEAPSANFAPVEQIDYTKTMQANHDKVMRDMNARLQQIERNGQVHIQNAKNAAFTISFLVATMRTAACKCCPLVSVVQTAAFAAPSFVWFPM